MGTWHPAMANPLQYATKVQGLLLLRQAHGQKSSALLYHNVQGVSYLTAQISTAKVRMSEHRLSSESINALVRQIFYMEE